MSVKLLIEHHFEFVSLKGGYSGSSESTLVKMSHCWKSHVAAHIMIQAEPALLSFRDDRLREVADCIEGIMDRCRGTTEQEQTLQRLIDKQKLLDTVDYFCRHFRSMSLL